MWIPLWYVLYPFNSFPAVSIVHICVGGHLCVSVYKYVCMCVCLCAWAYALAS